jgi:hypothetical protein
MMDVTKTIKERAEVYVDDNITNPTNMDYLLIENAMLIGANIVYEAQLEKKP